ncbi:NfeD family protein [Tistrella bauzanensis]
MAVVASIPPAAKYRRCGGQATGRGTGRPPTLRHRPQRVVEEAIRSGRGRVRLGDGSWSATGPDLATGTPVTVVAMDGTVLQVVASDRRSG